MRCAQSFLDAKQVDRGAGGGSAECLSIDFATKGMLLEVEKTGPRAGCQSVFPAVSPASSKNLPAG